MPSRIAASVADKMLIKNINHTRLQWIYGSFNRPDFYKFSLTKYSTESSFQTVDRTFEALIENQKLGREFGKLGRQFGKLGRVFRKFGRVLVVQHDPCCPNQPQYLAGLAFVLIHVMWFWFECYSIFGLPDSNEKKWCKIAIWKIISNDTN